MEPLTAVVAPAVVTWLPALMVPAPAAERLAAFNWMVAVPVASVSAVPEAGTIEASCELVVKGTTAFGTATHLASRTIARATAGAFVVDAPVSGSASVMTRLAVPTGAAGGVGAV